MSILVNPDAFPQAIRAVYDLAKLMPGKTEDFSRLLVPHAQFPENPIYRDGSEILKTAVNEAKTLGLISEIDGTLSAVRSFPDDRAYLALLCQSVLREEDKFCLAAQCFLLQDAYIAPKEKTFDDYQKNSHELAQFIPNNVQFSNFQRWMRYLGLARELGGELMPDPTRAIRNVWSEVTVSGESPIAEVYGRIRGVLPALPEINNAVVPSSVSYALKSLERSGQCVLQSQSDAEKWTLTLPHGNSVNISHVKFTGAKA